MQQKMVGSQQKGKTSWPQGHWLFWWRVCQATMKKYSWSLLISRHCQNYFIWDFLHTIRPIITSAWLKYASEELCLFSTVKTCLSITEGTATEETWGVLGVLSGSEVKGITWVHLVQVALKMCVGVKSVQVAMVTCLQLLILLLLQPRTRQTFDDRSCAAKPSSRSAVWRHLALSWKFAGVDIILKVPLIFLAL